MFWFYLLVYEECFGVARSSWRKSQLEKCSNLIGCCKKLENCSGIIPNLIGSKIGISFFAIICFLFFGSFSLPGLRRIDPYRPLSMQSYCNRIEEERKSEIESNTEQYRTRALSTQILSL
jgi:hypothetical protein